MVIIDLSLEISAGADVQGRGSVLLSSKKQSEAGDSREQKEHPDVVITDIVGAISLESPHAACSVTVDIGELTSQERERSFGVFCPGGAAAQEFHIQRNPERLMGAPSELTTVYFISLRDQRYTVTLDREESEKKINLIDRSVNLEILHMGVRHIGAASDEWFRDSTLSIPEGIDHILFVLTLVLASTSLLSLVKNVTGFTVGHSISMAVVTLLKTAVNPAIIEPAIAASIALMALDAMRTKPRLRAWIPASLFGLLHGCGFASALLELKLEGSKLVLGLVLFNLGVEIGQLVFVVIFWLLVSLATKLVGSRRPVTVVISDMVFVVATYWFIERMWGVL
jgi:uncharacterized membrane protein (UPF0136 family)